MSFAAEIMPITTWKKDGREVPISSLDTVHLKSALGKMRMGVASARDPKSANWYQRRLDALMNEAKRRVAAGADGTPVSPAPVEPVTVFRTRSTGLAFPIRVNCERNGSDYLTLDRRVDDTFELKIMEDEGTEEQCSVSVVLSIDTMMNLIEKFALTQQAVTAGQMAEVRQERARVEVIVPVTVKQDTPEDVDRELLEAGLIEGSW